MLIGVLIFIIIGLGVIIGLLIKALLIQIKKNEVHENWIISVQEQVEKTYSIIKQLDDRQIFYTDDDVGIVFKEMVNLIGMLKTMVSNE